jgi:hypothetical protein
VVRLRERTFVWLILSEDALPFHPTQYLEEWKVEDKRMQQISMPNDIATQQLICVQHLSWIQVRYVGFGNRTSESELILHEYPNHEESIWILDLI